MTRLNFSKAKMFDIPELMVFIKPFLSRLHRVFRVPSGYPPEKEKEISQVLTSLCKIYHKGVWYFDLRDVLVAEDVINIFVLMDVECILARLDAEPTYSN